MAKAFYGGENHGYLTFRAHTQALAACAVVSAALGTVAPPPGRLPAAVHCVSQSVVRDLTVHMQRDAQGKRRHDTLSAGAAPPGVDRPSLTEDDVRRFIADAVSGLQQVLHPGPQEPAQAPTTNAFGGASRPSTQRPLLTHPEAQQAPLSQEGDAALPDGGAAPGQSQGITAARMSSPARPQAAASSPTSRLSRRIRAAAGTPSDPGQPAAGHAGAEPPRPGPSDVATDEMSHDVSGTDCREEAHQRALTSTPVAPVAPPPAPASKPLATQAHHGAEASAPPTRNQPPEGPTLDWCAVCRFWRPSPCDQCPPQQAPQEAEEAAAEPALEGERELGPNESSPALDTPTPHAADDPPPPPIDVDASQDTGTQLACLLDDEADALSPLDPLPPAVVSDDNPKPPAAGYADGPLGEVGPHESRLAALIADTALDDVNPCRAMDVAVFLDSERLSAVLRRMRGAGQDTTPSSAPIPRRETASFPSWPSMPKGPARCSSSWALPWESPLSPSPAGKEMPSRPLTRRDLGSGCIA